MFIPPKYDLFSSIFSCSFLVLSTLHVFPISVFIFLGPCSHGSELVFPSEFSAILPVSIYTPNFLSVFIFSISTVFQSVSPSCGSSPSVSAVSHPTIFFVSVSHSQLFSQLLFSSLHHLQSHCKPDPDFRLSPTALKSSSAIPFFFFFFVLGTILNFCSISHCCCLHAQQQRLVSNTCLGPQVSSLSLCIQITFLSMLPGPGMGSCTSTGEGILFALICEVSADYTCACGCN